jgi:predicted ATP-grasp superfamily ATP-dependent carboligase
LWRLEYAVKIAAKPAKVLALGSGITLLGVLRTLSEENVEVIALPDVDRATRRSRWYRAAPLAFAGMKPDELARCLETLPVPTVLMPCTDLWARTVAALPAEVLARYPASIAPAETLNLLVDKARFGAALDRLGLPHPATRPLESVEDLDSVSDAALDRSFLKPVHSQQFFARFGVKAFRITGRSDAQSRLRECIGAGFQLMLQEYIPGPPTNHYFIDGFVDREGVVRALFARRRLRMSPPDFGNNTMQISVPVSDTGDASATLRTLLTDIDYRGIFSAEFKRDPRDGTFNLIEVNARPWWYVEFAARCGVNVCEMAIRDALGDPVRTISEYAVGRRCVFPYYDLQAVRTEMSAGRLGWLEWARSWVGPYQPVFRWSDPLPALGEVAALIGARLRKFAKQHRHG